MDRMNDPRGECGARHRGAVSFVLFAFALLPTVAFAWSAPGHRITALVAEQSLSGEARRTLREITGGEPLEDVALWLDQQRDGKKSTWPGMERWHYDNRPVCDPATSFSSQCADGNCPLAAYDRYVKVLADPAAGREARLDALRVVVHVLGDVHQPLHSGDNGDRGGNDVAVDMGPGQPPRALHGNWDRELVDRAKGRDSNRQFARRLARKYARDAARWQTGTVRDWMQESYDIARTFTYPRLPGFVCGRPVASPVQLSPEYRAEGARIAEERLARAGIRLAGVLNATLAR